MNRLPTTTREWLIYWAKDFTKMACEAIAVLGLLIFVFVACGTISV